jgi:hypothetical protein
LEDDAVHELDDEFYRGPAIYAVQAASADEGGRPAAGVAKGVPVMRGEGAGPSHLAMAFKGSRVQRFKGSRVQGKNVHLELLNPLNP